MKAYRVTTDDNERGSDIVWAENATEAKKKAQYCECCEDADWIDIRVKRYPDLDGMEEKCCKEGAWFDDDIRLILVRDHSWACIEPEYGDCDMCSAKKYCHWHDDEEVSE